MASGALSEILQPDGMHSEWRLLLPTLARSGSGTVVLVGAPHMPFGPALDAQGVHPKRLLWVAVALPVQRLWSTEQALRCADVDAAAAWLDPVRPDQLRRLQMAAAGFAKLLFVVRPAQAQSESSPAVLRLWVSSCSDPADALEVRAIKRRGRRWSSPCGLRRVRPGWQSCWRRVSQGKAMHWVALRPGT